MKTDQGSINLREKTLREFEKVCVLGRETERI